MKQKGQSTSFKAWRGSSSTAWRGPRSSSTAWRGPRSSSTAWRGPWSSSTAWRGPWSSSTAWGAEAEVQDLQHGEDQDQVYCMGRLKSPGGGWNCGRLPCLPCVRNVSGKTSTGQLQVNYVLCQVWGMWVEKLQLANYRSSTVPAATSWVTVRKGKPTAARYRLQKKKDLYPYSKFVQK